ncbi:KEOPS complex Pcc1-like subunit [Halostella sp. JP-L12]|uniref:KEOPS complex subunit Pcc1 n=1 Tax=Halostella TaxID=1843185 RepID=UPI000EF7D0B1|nr:MULTISPECIES: KEOPS complex subunit Pcc1 [Halostella]NHN47565.1 KEOPS complex Pcc1-like subunit [Halostella sp. JP-L12]
MPTFVHETTLAFSYSDLDRARTVERSVSQEVDEIQGDRSATTVSRDGATVTVAVEAADLVALRAALNTWLSLVDVAEQTAAQAERTADSG